LIASRGASGRAHSAAREAVFTFSKTTGDFCPALVSSLERLGGVPHAGVFDNDSSIVASGTGRKAVLHDEGGRCLVTST
jgi:hypothetical protein